MAVPAFKAGDPVLFAGRGYTIESLRPSEMYGGDGFYDLAMIVRPDGERTEVYVYSLVLNYPTIKRPVTPS